MFAVIVFIVVVFVVVPIASIDRNTSYQFLHETQFVVPSIDFRLARNSFMLNVPFWRTVGQSQHRMSDK